MNLVYLGGEIPSNRKILIDAGVEHIGVSYWGLTKRGLPKTKEYLLSEKYPENVKIYVDGGAKQADKAGLSIRELEEHMSNFEDWIALNYDNIEAVIEFDSKTLGPVWLHEQRRTLGWELAEKYWPVWHPEAGHTELFALSEQWMNVAILGDTIESELSLAGRTRALETQFETKFHGLGCAKPDNLRQVPLTTASSLSWLSPMMRGETIVWDGTKLVRYGKKMKDQARPRYKAIIEKAGLDFNKILADDNVEVSRLAIWSYQQLEMSLKKKPPHITLVPEIPKLPWENEKLSDNSDPLDDPGSAETGGVEPDNRPLEVRKVSTQTAVNITPRDPSEIQLLPIFGLKTQRLTSTDADGLETVVDAPILVSTDTSLRQCNTCFIAANCPAFKPDNSCAFKLPIEVKTKEQLKSLMNVIIEIQGARVAFSRFAEEVNGGYPDPNVGQEIDRLFRIIKNSKEFDENKEFVRMTLERQSSGGLFNRVFGDNKESSRELPENRYSDIDSTRILKENLED